MKMYKLGILGTCNTHAEIFSGLFNKYQDNRENLDTHGKQDNLGNHSKRDKPDNPHKQGNPDKQDKLDKYGSFDFYGFGRARVEYIFGFDNEKTKEIASAYSIKNAVTDVTEMYDNVDAAMVIFRHGMYHAQYAIPFLKRRIPVFVDKPFTISEKDAFSIIKASEKYNTPLMGGSSLKYAPDTMIIKELLINETKTIRTAVLNFPATTKNPYGNLHFYGSHLVEMALEIFGYDCISVNSFEKNGTVTAILGYDEYNITLNFIPDSNRSYCVIFTEKDTIIREIDLSLVFKEQMHRFVDMLDTKANQQDLSCLYKSVKVVNAVIRSYEKNCEVIIKN
jgi:predicted dehydrogenase